MTELEENILRTYIESDNKSYVSRINETSAYKVDKTISSYLKDYTYSPRVLFYNGITPVESVEKPNHNYYNESIELYRKVKKDGIL